MLKQRVLTALVLIPLFLLVLFKANPYWFDLFTVVVILLAAWEWSSFMGIKPWPLRLCYPIIIQAIVTFNWSVFGVYVTGYFLLIGLVWWPIALILVARYPKGAARWGQSMFLRGLMGFFVLVPTWFALNFIRATDLYGKDNGIYALLFLFVLIWGADSGAYFVGKKWGKNKLAPEVSPGKTLQGMLGALITTVIISPFFLAVVPDADPNVFAVILLGLVTVLFSILGDLFESMLKRNVGMKDSGRIFPGHGGLLDRIDSLTAAAPIFALGSWLVLKT
jgi:phosphatidate cytidylyltransferase